jgi:hypothetical protein
LLHLSQNDIRVMLSHQDGNIKHHRFTTSS